ncbi:LacI family DNA-binding transcriptional regulator [Amycolatopsis sp. NPDC051903]|uniref:LacI family DNA-binding transcriptional regulator n=1 Tax=Amycolatopsis sp. NPDC051903 TaxID=3363936 RepID=UPI003798F7F0
MDRAPTIKDVAERAGVHAATASRALNPATRGMVNVRTANRVAEAARALGYAPNSAARSLRTRTSSVAGIIVPDLRNPVFPPIVRGIEDGLREAGYLALVGNTDGDPERERELLTAMRGRQTAGFILATSRRGDSFAGGPAVPTVLVNRRTDDGDTPSVTADNAAGVHLLVRHLVDLGHTRIGHVAGPRDLSTGWERYRAFLDATTSLGLEPAAAPVEFADAFTEPAGHAATLRLFAEHPGLTAVLAGNDLIALACYSALAELGRSVPGDVSVTGFNDMPFVDRQRPALTTVRLPHYEIGREAARLLLERIASPTAPAKRVVLPVELVRRDSTGPAKV